MFSKSENLYDVLYEALGKDYSKEADKAHKLIQKYSRSGDSNLLDVACGTGTHAGFLAKHYKVEGMDLDENMISLARKKHPKIRFFQGDMIDFNLNRRFDAITCLFSSIGYAKTKVNLRKAIKSMTRHLRDGGVLLVEPWFSPQQWNVGHVHPLHADKPELKVTRVSISGRKGNISTLDFHYLVGSMQGIEHFTEHHELGLFTHADYMKSFRAAGLEVLHDKKGLDGRGLYIGRKVK
ncbi:MAG: dTDP-3-amino-3,6-dideoxy-alpha-D-glucopyranose N,N-dimethyltransferase [Anaerolineales bacterium]|nr:dTDP-3-amino-3,6-dideoxy-alpha-D-glucopyranose N,N-dimethyltransferase [Anaerolineales bacterium]WKZ48288.1 MAG: class I SAM-dependent methyltransferase [Anaerolineales bacterium]